MLTTTGNALEPSFFKNPSNFVRPYHGRGWAGPQRHALVQGCGLDCPSAGRGRIRVHFLHQQIWSIFLHVTDLQLGFVVMSVLPLSSFCSINLTVRRITIFYSNHMTMFLPSTGTTLVYDCVASSTYKKIVRLC